MVKQSHNKRHNRKLHRKYSKKMYGGEFSPEDRDELLDMGFTQVDVDLLVENNSNINLVRMALQQNNPATGNHFTPQELIESLRDLIENEHVTDYTTNESSDEEDEDQNGGKRRKRRKTRKTRKSKTRKQRGGQCYGRGIGANSYDPNFSIFNTNELQLFPYKPTN